MDRPSLEALIEAEDLGLDILHPGGLAITRELARATGIVSGTRVLEVAAGTGETALLLAAEFGAQVTATDLSPRMIRRMRDKFPAHDSAVQLTWADAHQLPFRNNAFDVALSECAVCHFDKLRALREMARVVHTGGRVGIHDLCWKDGAPEALRQRLAEIEEERPETLSGWQRVFEAAGLADVQAFDRSDVITAWTRDTRRAMGLSGYLRAVKTALQRWGIRGLRAVLQSERIFSSTYLSYVLVVAIKK
ncbi:MAG TPA: methyltransferase domain-containing protein [Candidatus Acidoferrum sp.]|nr:methyltransferase domain-containing protein [Candidatus Acidoferrum sp.]